MRTNCDAYGQQLLAQYLSKQMTVEIIERDDNYIDTGSDPGLYFSEYRQWSPLEKRAIKLAKGRVLDVGCGAGRHALYLQAKNFDVVGIDNSPGAIRVCKLRGLKRAIVRSVGDWFDYLFVSPEEMREILSDTDWQIEELLNAEEANYVAVIQKKLS